jgi:hypothetical protein
MHAQKFDSNWWDDFLETTENMSKTSVLKDCLTKEETSIMRTLVLEVIAEIARLRTNQYGYRVFVDDKQLEYNELLKIFDVPPIKGETIEEWSKRVYGDQKFGMIINAGEKFNLELSKFIALKVQPLLEKVGLPREGINFTLFIGNYDNTPLGIHQDSPGENVIHFHLGPEGKTMYTWNNDEYEKLVGEMKFNNKQVDKYIPFATEFAFKEGDLYFMPQGEYHVGKNEGLSMALTFWFYNHSKERFANKLNTTVINQFLEKSKDLLKPDKNALDDVSGVDSTLELFEIPKALENLSLKDLMREAYRDLRYSIHSNAGYRTSPTPREEDILFDLEDYIEIEKPYKILYKESLDKEKIHVFVRGIKIELNNYDCIKGFIDEINKGNPLRVGLLLEKLDKDWDNDIGLYLLSELYNNNGITQTILIN